MQIRTPDNPNTKKPETKYAKSGAVSVAYQVLGTGAIDLVYVPGWISNIDLMWACTELVEFLNQLASISRVILFDKRGTGLSDRVANFPTLEERMDDIRAVMDAVDSNKAVLFGHSEGGSVSALFAATYPNRVISLMAFGIFAKRIYATDYPWAPTNEQRQVVYDMIAENWGSGEMNLESLAPSKADDSVFMDWLAAYFRSGASPSAALKLTKMNTQVDIINILEAIKVPTLIMQRTHDIDVKIEEGRFIADRIEGAKFVEFDGSDHLFWTGNTEEVLDQMKNFILNVKPPKVYEKQLFTIIVGRFHSSVDEPEAYAELINKYVNQYDGVISQYQKDRFTVTFNGPSKAVYCAMDLQAAIENDSTKLDMAIHIQECSTNDSIGEEIEDLANSIFHLSNLNGLLVTQTVKNLLIGVNLKFTFFRRVSEATSIESILLYTVNKELASNLNKSLTQRNQVSQDDSLFEQVIQTIENNISNEYFNVDMLCKKIGVSERQLQRKLKSLNQKSPNQLISSMRLNLARDLILNRSGTISEIAYQTGFSNPSYFSKRFKTEFGISPSELMD
ncbi:MAG: alpha/beta fold hydrolase [Flavobacteriales bacterium]